MINTSAICLRARCLIFYGKLPSRKISSMVMLALNFNAKANFHKPSDSSLNTSWSVLSHIKSCSCLLGVWLG